MSRASRQLKGVKTSQTLFKFGCTAILLGYFMVWLPHNLAGLSFIGLEIGEWVKFLPQVRSGQIPADRVLFYLPPITLGLILALWTTGWPNRRWQSWVMRAVAVLIAMLAFPALEVILYEGSDQWLGRLIMILAVAITALLVSRLQRLPNGLGFVVARGLTLIVALGGLVLPTWAYLEVRPAVAELFSGAVGIGPGLWLNGIGHLLVALPALSWFLERRSSPSSQSGGLANEAEGSELSGRSGRGVG